MEESPGGGRGDGRGVVGRTIGHYVVESKIGKGGMGEVYLARDTRLPRHVALKRMAPELRDDPDYRRRFQEEAEKAIRISDRRIASVLDVIEETDEIYIVLEYVPGPSLRQRINGRMDVRTFLPLAVECTDALAAAHRSGIVHRDVKPENYVIGPRGAVKLLDLGVAKVVPRSDGDSTVPLFTQSTLIGGTPAYMAPEALRGLRSDVRSDIFSLGVMFYEMLSGEHPFRAPTQPATQDRILHEEPIPLSSSVPTVPRKLERLVTRMIAKDCEQRPPTTHDVLHDLLEIEEYDESERPPSKIRAVLDWTDRHRVVSIFGAVALVVAIAMAILKPVLSPTPPLPDDLRVRIVTFTSTKESADSRIVGAGITGVLEQILQRLTDPNPLEIVSRERRSFRPLLSVTRDPVRPRTTLDLSGVLSTNRTETEIQLALVSRADSLVLRRARVRASATDPLMLVERTIEAAAGMLELDITPEELARLQQPRTHNNTAFAFELRARGYLLEAGALQDPRDSAPWRLDSPQVRESADVPLQLRAAYLDSAESAYRQACAADSMDAPAWYGRAFARWRKHQVEQRVAVPQEVPAWCQHALQIHLDHAESHALLGEVYAAMDRSPAAIGEIERAIALNPTDAPSVRRLVQLYEQQGRSEDVENLYRHQVRRFPRSYYWYSWYGTYFFRHAAYDSAAIYYQAALDREPNEDKTLASMGTTCLYQGRHQSAIPYLRAAITLQPTALRYSNLGSVLFVTRRLAAAESAYAEAITLDPDYYMLWGNLGDSRHWNPAARERAPEAYRKAITLAIGVLGKAPNDRLVLVRLAHYHTKIGELEIGRAELERALRGMPNDHDVLYKAALVYDQLAEPDSAFAYLQRALDAGFSPLWVKETPELDDLRDDPRFDRLETMVSAAH